MTDKSDAGSDALIAKMGAQALAGARLLPRPPQPMTARRSTIAALKSKSPAMRC
jgi:hypothetical protein